MLTVMTMLSKVVGKKSLIFLSIIAVLLLFGGLLYWRYDSVKESLILANKEIDQVASELLTSEETIRYMERDYKLLENLLVDKEQQAIKSERLAASLSAQLEKEKRDNEDLQVCLPVDMSGYAERVLEFSSYSDSDGDEGNNTN